MTMGNLDLHLIKGRPAVHADDDLVNARNRNRKICRKKNFFKSVYYLGISAFRNVQ